MTENAWTIPNLLTVARILLTPGFVMAFVDKRFELAWLLFAIAGLTDALDGFLARVLRQRTHFGAMLDPLADKVLLVTSFLCLAFQGWIPSWLAVLVVSRDVLIVGGLAFLRYSGVDLQRGIRPVLVSKATTVAQIALVLLIMVEHTFAVYTPASRSALVLIVTALTTLSGAYYVRVGLGMIPVNGAANNKD
jgi:cardiolipin synthase